MKVVYRTIADEPTVGVRQSWDMSEDGRPQSIQLQFFWVWFNPLVVWEARIQALRTSRAGMSPR